LSVWAASVSLIAAAIAGLLHSIAASLSRRVSSAGSTAGVTCVATSSADGTAGAVVTGKETARRLANGEPVLRILSAAFARAEKGRMPKAPAIAAQKALALADQRVADLKVVTTHNPFAVNDLWLHRETGFPLDRMNPLGCSLIYGHPQAPTGLRAIAELAQALVLQGGGVGLFTGCAAGDMGAAVVISVE